MKHLILLLSMLITQGLWAAQYKLQDEATHSLEFFLENAYDQDSGSFASNIDFEGNVVNSERALIATSRLIYGLAEGVTFDTKYLKYANSQAAFLLDKMLAFDSEGRSYFHSKVADGNGSVIEGLDNLIVNYQAYGLNGLVRLYQVTKEPSILQKIESIYDDFYARFHDDEFGGFYDAFNISSQKATKTKSYNSTVYVASSFLIELYRATGDEKYRRVLEELGDIIATHFVDSETNWIFENFTNNWQVEWRSWQVQGDNTIGIVGHNTQAAWVLLRLAEFVNTTKSNFYKGQAAIILKNIFESGAVDDLNGGVFDAFKRETNETMWHNNKAWWQQIETILALELAKKLNLFSDDSVTAARAEIVLSSTRDFYETNFIDRENGGEFANVSREGVAITGEAKGSAGKSVYHTLEYTRYMNEY